MTYSRFYPTNSAYRACALIMPSIFNEAQVAAVATLPRPNRLNAVCRSGSHLRPAIHKQKNPSNDGLYLFGGPCWIDSSLTSVSLSPQWGAVAALPRPNRLNAVCRSGSHLRPAIHKQKNPSNDGLYLFGGPCWIRTSDQLVKSQLLYQLS